MPQKRMGKERAIRYLLRLDMNLTATCEDLQNRLRGNNLRIYCVPEGSEEKDVKEFAKELIQFTNRELTVH